ncbi:hypothetical protein OIO90_000206 [Microbotryomycetes sp. JL221]|nr:hypothetical protein OIO90_000206 [Microbotryomycetes sp. JL221]
MTKPFRLSSTLVGHGADVRAVTASPLGPTLFSSSRDGTARCWIRSGTNGDASSSSSGGNGGGWSAGLQFSGQHEGFVNAAQWIPGDGQGYLATAGQDKIIYVWPVPESLSDTSAKVEPVRTLIDHDNNVCSLATSSDGRTLISGSWDKSAKVWKDFELKHTLRGHEQSVWAVLVLDAARDLYLTGSADNTVKLWQGDRCTKTFTGHIQAVRALARLGPSSGAGDLFASAGNDASIRIWSLKTGETVHTLYGHDSFIYSLSAMPEALGGGLVSSGEDRTVRVWKAQDGKCEQTIVIPAISVWCVTVIENGDIAAGTSDGIVRVFTRADDRVASAEALADYDVQVSKAAVNSSQIGDIKKDSLPGLEALTAPGKKDGQVIMVKGPDGTVEAHSWSNASGTWAKIGEVTGGVGSNQKQMYNGQEYDYVFDVDFKDGAPKLKLPYNNGQNAYEAAQKFLIANELPLEYVDEVVRFIDKNTGGVTLGGNTQYVDPYTGASRYTGGGVQPQQGSSSSFSGDPYTGGGRTAPKAISVLPHKTPLTFAQANLSPLRAKVGGFNDQLSLNGPTAPLALSEADITQLDELIVDLTAKLASSGSQAGLGVNASVAVKMLQWPSSFRFPGIDLVRLTMLYEPDPDALPLLLETISSSGQTSKEAGTNTMLALRALANAFNTADGQSVMSTAANEVLSLLRERGTAGLSKTGKVALSTAALNYSILAVNRGLENAAADALVDIITALLQDVDGEVVYRSVVALGNLVVGQNADLAGLGKAKQLANEASRRMSGETRIKQVVDEISSKK